MRFDLQENKCLKADVLDCDKETVEDVEALAETDKNSIVNDQVKPKRTEPPKVFI